MAPVNLPPAPANGLTVIVENVLEGGPANTALSLDTTTTAMNTPNSTQLVPLPSPVQEATPGTAATADDSNVASVNPTAGMNTSSMQPMTMPVATSGMATSAGTATAATTSGMSIGVTSMPAAVATPVATPQSGYSTPMTPLPGCGY
jgi:hypothetical protein